jgi:hypothetical protein
MVHGFNSSSDQAWGEFPRIIKSEKDTAFLGFNVLRYGYGSAVCRNKVDISDRGDGLKSFLSDELKNYDGMIIMGHSLGGLVAMHGLIKLAKVHHPDLERIPVAVMTFGTPHIGVQGAERLGQIGFLCTDKQAEAAKVFDRSLDELRVDWESYFGSNAPKYHVTIRTFYGPDDSFVYQASACGRFPGCEQVDGENHVMIVKPSDTNHLAYKKLRVQVDSMTDLIYGPTFAKRSPPSSKEEQKLNSINTTIPVPSNSITKPRMLDDTATLLKTCDQSIVGLKRRPDVFLPAWRSVVDRLHKERLASAHDLLNLYNLKIRMRDEPNDPEDLFREALFTLKCLEDVGELRMEKLGTTSTYWGKNFENQMIIFRNP